MPIARNFNQLEKHLQELDKDVYAQPPDMGHTHLAMGSIGWILKSIPERPQMVLDVGAGQGFCQPVFLQNNIKYLGISLGQDVLMAQQAGHNVVEGDYNFLSLPDNSIDLIYSRHSLEHSFSPLISLMEWHRVSRKYLGLVLPAPEHYHPGGRNHPFVLFDIQWKALLEQTGWTIIQELIDTETNWEYWYLCEKTKRPDYAAIARRAEEEKLLLEQERLQQEEEEFARVKNGLETGTD